MARKARVKERGAIYHIIQRGNNQEYIFQGLRDKNYLLKQLRELKLGLGYKIYAYVIMDNHYHLMLQTLGADVNDVMHRLNSKYGSYYNSCYERSGHVFQGRYKSSIILDERYLFSVLRYIHQNPVRAGITRSVSDYHWSSDRVYRQNITDGFVDIAYIMDMFSPNRAQAQANYCYFMEEALEEPSKDPKATVIGVKDDEEGYKSPINETNDRKDYERKSLDNILKEVVRDHREYELIKQGSRQRFLTITKLNYIKVALQWQYTHKEIGQSIGISDRGVRKLLIRN
jgi:putative transposase